MNRITLVGNVGGDAEIRTTSTGARVASFSVATNDGYRNSAGEWVDDPTWHRRMTYRKWRKDGEKTDRTQAEIVLDRNAEIEFHSPLAGED